MISLARDKKKKIFLICFSLFYVALIVVASFYDLEISKAMADVKAGKYYSDNMFARFFEVAGELPVYFVSSFAVGVLASNIPRGLKKGIGIALQFLAMFVLFGILLFCSFRVFKNISEMTESFSLKDPLIILSEFLLAGLLFVIMIFSVHSLEEKTRKSLLKFAFIAVLTALLSQISVQGIKLFWGRARYRTLAFANDFDMYSPWYIPQGKKYLMEKYSYLALGKDAYCSFPSGHSCSVATLVALFAIPVDSTEGGKVKKIFIYTVCSVAIIIVMISRMVMGAHYLSDVLFGTGFTLLSYAFANFIFKKTVAKRGRMKNEP